MLGFPLVEAQQLIPSVRTRTLCQCRKFRCIGYRIGNSDSSDTISEVPMYRISYQAFRCISDTVSESSDVSDIESDVESGNDESCESARLASPTTICWTGLYVVISRRCRLSDVLGFYTCRKDC